MTEKQAAELIQTLRWILFTLAFIAGSILVH